MIAALLAAALLAPAPTPDGEEPVRAATEAPALPSAAGRLERALRMLRAGGEEAARLLEEAGNGSAAVRRAALEAIGTLEPGAAPPEALRPALAALGSEDPLLRGAGIRALLACGDAARPPLEAALEGTPPADLPAVPRARAADALFDLRRAAVERDFLALWSPNDGTFRGMFESLRAHGPVAARVLTAIALDRRMAGGTVLGIGPYSWLRPPSPDKERSETRYRAIGALEDAGDHPARERLRRALRKAPAADLYDFRDEDPVPAALDDALRRTIAALGDPGPLLEMIRASEESGGSGWRAGFTELRRQAGAYATLAESAPDPERARGLFDKAVNLWDETLPDPNNRVFGRFPADGVDYYNYACILARRDAPGDRAKALGHLDRAMDTYSVTAEWVARDGDLANLRTEPRFAAILRRLREKEKALEGR